MDDQHISREDFLHAFGNLYRIFFGKEIVKAGYPVSDKKLEEDLRFLGKALYDAVNEIWPRKENYPELQGGYWDFQKCWVLLLILEPRSAASKIFASSRALHHCVDEYCNRIGFWNADFEYRSIFRCYIKDILTKNIDEIWKDPTVSEICFETIKI